MKMLENDENIGEQKEFDAFLVALCFLIFVFVGYLLTHYLPH